MVETTMKFTGNFADYSIFAIANSNHQFGVAFAEIQMKNRFFVSIFAPKNLNLFQRSFIRLLIENDEKNNENDDENDHFDRDDDRNCSFDCFVVSFFSKNILFSDEQNNDRNFIRLFFFLFFFFFKFLILFFSR